MTEAPGARKSLSRSPTGAGSSSPREAMQEADALDAAQQAETTIHARDDHSDANEAASDSGYYSDSGSARSMSLSSSVRDFPFENGRRYNRFREGRYNFPNDDLEQEREHMKHIMVLTLMSGHLHFAPLCDDPTHIIDLGTGIGGWAMEMGDQYPSAEVIGIDLSPIQPDWVPPNVKFLVDDAESQWLDPVNHFDLVHARHTVQAFRDYSGVLAQAYNHIKPGGWVELQEFDYTCHCDDGSQPEDYKFSEMMITVGNAVKSMGIEFCPASQIRDKVIDAGFINVTERVLKLPIGPWPQNQLLRKVGAYYLAVIHDGLQAIALRPLTKGLGWSPEAVEIFLSQVRQSLNDRSIHSYMKLYVVYGQKPPTPGYPPAL